MILDPAALFSVIGGLVAAISYLWRLVLLQNRRLSSAEYKLGQFETLVGAVHQCPVQGCYLKTMMPEVKLSAYRPITNTTVPQS